MVKLIPQLLLKHKLVAEVVIRKILKKLIKLLIELSKKMNMISKNKFKLQRMLPNFMKFSLK
jgi:hypothetical protein